MKFLTNKFYSYLGNRGCDKETQFPCYEDHKCNTFECTDFVCKDEQTIIKPKCIKFECRKYECQKFSRSKAKHCLQYGCAEFVCIEYEIPEKVDPKNTNCSTFECKGYRCVDSPSDHHVDMTCQKFTCNNYQVSYEYDNYDASYDANKMSCTDYECKTESSVAPVRPKCKKNKTTTETRCLKYERAIIEDGNPTKPRCVNMESFQKVECLEYFDAENKKDERQCKRFGPAVNERRCMKYESVLADLKGHVKPKCKQFETHICAEYFDSDASAVCVPKEKKCDGKVDCPNGRDEDITVCGKV